MIEPGQERRYRKQQRAFHHEQRFRLQDLCFVQARVGGEVVDRHRDRTPVTQRIKVLGQQFEIDRVGVIEVDLRGIGARLASVVVVLAQHGTARRTEALRQVFDERRLARAAAARDPENGHVKTSSVVWPPVCCALPTGQGHRSSRVSGAH